MLIMHTITQMLGFQSRPMKTNTVSNTAFRGFGGPQGVLAAAERIIEEISFATGQDPLDVRKVKPCMVILIEI